jgi:hypothetical protein
MHCRLPAPDVVIVHARQIVVDQRINVNGLDRCTGTDRALSIDAEQLRGRDGKERPQALATANGSVTHGREQLVTSVVAAQEQSLKEIVDFRRDAAGLAKEVNRCLVDRLSRHRSW